MMTGCSKDPVIHYKAVDGDTFTAKSDDGSSVKYHLINIDAPEREQPYGREAKFYLDTLLQKEGVQIISQDGDKVELIVNGQSLNLELVNLGYAWASPQIQNQSIKTLYTQTQSRAASMGKGLWGLGHGLMVAPWQWRAQGREQTKRSLYQQQRLNEKKRQAELRYKLEKEKQIKQQELLRIQRAKKQSNTVNTSKEKTTL